MDESNANRFVPEESVTFMSVRADGKGVISMPDIGTVVFDASTGRELETLRGVEVKGQAGDMFWAETGDSYETCKYVFFGLDNAKRTSADTGGYVGDCIGNAYVQGNQAVGLSDGGAAFLDTHGLWTVVPDPMGSTKSYDSVISDKGNIYWDDSEALFWDTTWDNSSTGMIMHYSGGSMGSTNIKKGKAFWGVSEKNAQSVQVLGVADGAVVVNFDGERKAFDLKTEAEVDAASIPFGTVAGWNLMRDGTWVQS